MQPTPSTLSSGETLVLETLPGFRRPFFLKHVCWWFCLHSRDLKVKRQQQLSALHCSLKLSQKLQCWCDRNPVCKMISYDHLSLTIAQLSNNSICFLHLTQIPEARCGRPLSQAGTPHGPACHSRSKQHPVPPSAWRWSSSHCRFLLSGQLHMEGEGAGACPRADKMTRLRHLYIIAFLRLFNTATLCMEAFRIRGWGWCEHKCTTQ